MSENVEINGYNDTFIKAGKAKKSSFYDFGCHTCKKNISETKCCGVDARSCISKYYTFHENKDNLSEETKQNIKKGKKFIKDHFDKHSPDKKEFLEDYFK